MIDTQIESELNDPTPYKSIASIEEFFKVTEGRPRLVYGDKAVLVKMKGLTTNLVLENESQATVINVLTKDSVLWVDDPDLMRGFDYLTTVKSGIALLIASPMSSHRAIR